MSPNIDTRTRPLLKKKVLVLSSCLLKTAFKTTPSVQNLCEHCLEQDTCGTWADGTAAVVAGPPIGAATSAGVSKP